MPVVALSTATRCPSPAAATPTTAVRTERGLSVQGSGAAAVQATVGSPVVTRVTASSSSARPGGVVPEPGTVLADAARTSPAPGTGRGAPATHRPGGRATAVVVADESARASPPESASQIVVPSSAIGSSGADP